MNIIQIDFGDQHYTIKLEDAAHSYKYEEIEYHVVRALRCFHQGHLQKLENDVLNLKKIISRAKAELPQELIHLVC